MKEVFLSFSTQEPSQTTFVARSFERALCYEENYIFHILSCCIKVICEEKFHTVLPGDTYFCHSQKYTANGL